MNVLLVHAHPEPQSFSAAMMGTAIDEFSAQGHALRVSDLYAMRFDPVAKADDFGSRSRSEYLVYALEQRHGFEARTLAADIRAELDKLLWCDLLVLNFPIFWFSTPAILKGWIDRVFISGRVYGGKRFYDRGGMAGKRVLVCATLGGQPHMFGPNAIHGELEAMLSHLLRGTLAYAGFAVLPPFFAYHVPYISQAAREGVMASFRARLQSLHTDTALAFASLADFDDALRPKAMAQPVL